MQLLAVAIQLLARILVVTAVPAQPVAGARFPVLAQHVLIVGFVADDVDMADLRRGPFVHVDRHVHPVAVQVRHRGRDLDVVLAAVVVLAGQLLGHPVQGEAVEGIALGQADLRQTAHQVLGLDVLVAGQGQAVDRRALGDRDHQDVALAAHAHVFEEAGAVQGADAFTDAGLVNLVAALERQVGEHGAGADALQPVHADIADRECLGGRRALDGWRRLCGLLGPGGGHDRRRKGDGEQVAAGISRHLVRPS